MPRTAGRCWWRGPAARFTSSCRSARSRAGRPHLSQGVVRAVARRVPDRHAQLSQFYLNKRDDHSDTCILGSAQLAWLKRELVASNATWKVIAADMPIGVISEDAIALGDGPPERREHEIADLLSFMKRAGVRNTVWLTADMHYTAAHHYDPSRAVFQDFEPFWEFISGPLHAGNMGARPTRQHIRSEGDVSEGLQGGQAKTCRLVSGCNSSAA